MSAAAPSATPRNARDDAASTEKLRNTWRTRIQQAKSARKPYERTWLSNLAFAAGQHWLVNIGTGNEMRHIQQVDPKQAARVLYTADRINEYLQAQLGELNQDDDRPELITAQEGDTAEEVAKELNQAVQHGWEHEWNAANALARARKYTLTMGVSALRMRFDPTRGKIVDHQPVGSDGQPIQDPFALATLHEHGTLPDGTLPRFHPVHEGQSIIEPFSAFQTLTPPGVVHEDDFPWEVLVRPVHVDAILEEYGVTVTEDTDIASASGLTLGQNSQGTRSTNDARLRDHAWLYSCYQRPCRQYPEGQFVVLAGNDFTLVHQDEKLAYTNAAGERKSGIVYFHWWRLDDRFYSRSFIEPLKDPQRALNETKTIKREILVRGLPKVFVTKGSLVENPTGVPMEKIEVEKDGIPPVFHQGVGPGPWWDTDVVEAAEDLAHASTLSALRLGENPQHVDTYSQLALLNENEATKRSPIVTDHNAQKARLVEYGVHDIREWWPESKTILVSGDEGSVSQQTFQKSKVPDFYMVRVPTGAPQPRSQAANIKLIDAIWMAAEQSGVITHDPDRWVQWYADSIKAGTPLDLPEAQKDSQQQFAAFENFLLEQGEQPPPAEYDLAPIHIPVHREAQDHARAKGDLETFKRIQEHITAHIQMVPETRKAYRYLDPTDTSDIASDNALDEDQALRENDMMVEGRPLNPEEYAKAYGSLQRRLNPETGQPVTPQDDLKGILERASLKPTLVENLQMHMDKHGKVIKSEEFLSFPPDVRQRFLTHFNLTREMWLSLPTMPDKVAAPKVTLTARESVGPTTVAQILRRAGVPEADPQLLATEPPMENMVADDVDAPDVDGGAAGQTGNGKPVAPAAPGKTSKPKKPQKPTG